MIGVLWEVNYVFKVQDMPRRHGAMERSVLLFIRVRNQHVDHQFKACKDSKQQSSAQNSNHIQWYQTVVKLKYKECVLSCTVRIARAHCSQVNP